jgi:hypothetical protein
LPEPFHGSRLKPTNQWRTPEGGEDRRSNPLVLEVCPYSGGARSGPGDESQLRTFGAYRCLRATPSGCLQRDPEGIRWGMLGRTAL